MNDKPRRRPMTPARKRRIHDCQRARLGIADGPTRCGNGCGAAVPLEGPGVIYEHVELFWMRPDLDDDGPNVQAWCAACAKAKNARGADPTRLAKTKRQAKMSLDVERPPPTMRSGGRKLAGRGFGKQHRPMQSRNSFRDRRG
jgi:hypothetical protein